MIVALDRVVGVSPSGATIERAARERTLGTDAQVASMRAAIVPPVAPRSDGPHLLTLKETTHPAPATMAAEPSITPAEQSITPAAPSIKPAEPSITPAEPSLTPAEPSITPAEPSITPAEP